MNNFLDSLSRVSTTSSYDPEPYRGEIYLDGVLPGLIGLVMSNRVICSVLSNTVCKVFDGLKETNIFTATDIMKLGPNALTCFQLNGEPVQIAIYPSEQMLKQLEEQNIVVSKPTASTTEIAQPGDISCRPDSTPHILLLTDDEYQSHEANSRDMPSHQKKLFKLRLLCMQMALVNSMRSQMIIDYFAFAGFYPNDPRTGRPPS